MKGFFMSDENILKLQCNWQLHMCVNIQKEENTELYTLNRWIDGMGISLGLLFLKSKWCWIHGGLFYYSLCFMFKISHYKNIKIKLTFF